MIKVITRLLKFLPVPLFFIYLIASVDLYPADSGYKKAIVRDSENPEKFRREIVLRKEIEKKHMVFTTKSEYIVEVEFDKIFDKRFLDFIYKLAIDYHRNNDKDFIINFYDVSELFSDFILKNDSYVVRHKNGEVLNQVNIELCREELGEKYYPSTRYHIEMYDPDGILILRFNSVSSKWQNYDI
ncbi:MAG TPA: hypothetical protein PKA63_01070 [Oligoflexia bacterium]|nr:hypothetical protein [Oligoflexia bacterium]HMP47240.1 hypothetical protein [Oligoflexia bacterium]